MSDKITGNKVAAPSVKLTGSLGLKNVNEIVETADSAAQAKASAKAAKESEIISGKNAVTAISAAENAAEEASTTAAKLAAEKAAEEASKEFDQLFQNRFSLVSPTPWQPRTEVSNPLQVYSHIEVGVETMYLPDPQLVPFVTGATFDDDRAKFGVANLVNVTQMRTDSASQMSGVYKKDYETGDIIPADAMKDKLMYWHNGQFYSVGTNTGFKSSDFDADLAVRRFIGEKIAKQSYVNEYTELSKGILEVGIDPVFGKTRIPAICVNKLGHIFAFCDLRSSSADAPASAIEIGMTVSKNGGQDWSAVESVMSLGATGVTALTDPCVIYDQISDTIYIFALNIDKSIIDPAAIAKCYMSKSTAGSSFSTPVDITDGISDSEYSVVFQAPGNAVFKDGYIYLPLQYWHPTGTGDQSQSGVARSNDGGISWEKLGRVQIRSSECAISFFGDRLIMVTKREGGSAYGRIMSEYDFTNSQWGTIQWGKLHVSTQGSLLEVNTSDFHCLLRCQNYEEDVATRTHLTISVSRNGYNFADTIHIKDSVGLGYSSLAHDDKYLHVLYETATGVSYKRFNLNQVLSANFPLNMEILDNKYGQLENGVWGLQPDVVTVINNANGAQNVSSIERDGVNNVLTIKTNATLLNLKVAQTDSVMLTAGSEYQLIVPNKSEISIYRKGGIWEMGGYQVSSETIRMNSVDFRGAGLYKSVEWFGTSAVQNIDLPQILLPEIGNSILDIVANGAFLVTDGDDAYALPSKSRCSIKKVANDNVIYNCEKVQVASNSNYISLSASGGLSVPINVYQIVFNTTSLPINFIKITDRESPLSIVSWTSADILFVSNSTNTPTGYQKLWGAAGDFTLKNGGVLTIYPTEKLITAAIMS